MNLANCSLALSLCTLVSDWGVLVGFTANSCLLQPKATPMRAARVNKGSKDAAANQNNEVKVANSEEEAKPIDDNLSTWNIFP